MRRTVLPLLTVLALLLVAAGGVAASDAGTTIGTADETDTDDADAGICLVGADSPCTDTPADETAGDRIDDGAADDGQMRIPEDRNGDGEIDDRFRGDGDDADAGICLVGADTPCTDRSDEGTHIGGDSDGSEKQVWIPEDQNRDGVIDDRFADAPPVETLTALFRPAFPGL